jgi:hypothetical protein
MKEQIAVCLVVTDMYFETMYCIENLVAKTTFKPMVRILDNGSKDHKLKSYLKQVCDTNKWYLKTVETPMEYSKAWNFIMERSPEPYCCLLPINILVNNGWLEALYSTYKQCLNSGVIGIRNGNEKVSLMPLLHDSTNSEDEVHCLWVEEDRTINGIMFFEKEKLNLTGFFDTQLNAKGYEQSEFSFRFSANGYNNYYITKHTCIKATEVIHADMLPVKTAETYKNYVEAINIMFNLKRFKK